MELLEDLKSGKYNLVLIGILFVFMFHQYWCISRSTKEPMADVSVDIKDAVKQVYLADVEAIRNLSEVATKLQKEGLTIPLKNKTLFYFLTQQSRIEKSFAFSTRAVPGNLTVTGQIKANSSINAGGEIGNNSNSISQITSKLNELSNSINSTNNSINQINSSLTNSVNEINQRMPVFVRFIASSKRKYIKPY